MPSFPPPTPPTPWRPEVPDALQWSGLAPAPSAPPEGPRDGLAGVPWWAPLVAFVGALIVGIIASVIAAGVAAVGGSSDFSSSDKIPNGVLVFATLVQDAALVVLAVAFVRIFAGSGAFARLGYRRLDRPWVAVGWVALAIVGFFILALLVTALLGQPGKQDLVKELEKEDSLAALIGLGAVTVIGAPLAEETFFRGFLFGTLRERMPTWGAVLLTGALFGSVHLPAPGQTILVLAGLGALLCLVYSWTGSLVPCFALHAFVNSVTFASTKHFSVAGGAGLVIGAVGTVVVVGSLASHRVRA